MTTLFRAALGATLIVLAALSLPANAFAYARYKSSTPGAGEVLTTSPAQVDISFTQHIQKVSGTDAITPPIPQQVAPPVTFKTTVGAVDA